MQVRVNGEQIKLLIVHHLNSSFQEKLQEIGHKNLEVNIFTKYSITPLFYIMIKVEIQIIMFTVI